MLLKYAGETHQFRLIAKDFVEAPIENGKPPPGGHDAPGGPGALLTDRRDGPGLPINQDVIQVALVVLTLQSNSALEKIHSPASSCVRGLPSSAIPS